MAGYIGNQPVQAYSAGTQKDIFVPDGTIRRFAFQFNKPQLQASDVILVVNNVIQNPGSTYDLIDLYEVLLTGLTGGTFVVGSTVTSGANSGVIVVSEGSRIFVEMTTGLFAPGNVLTSGAVSGTVESSTFQDNRGLKFASAPLVTDEIYAITSGLPTIFALPPDGSITAEKLSADLKRIDVDKFTATAGQTQIILSRTPATADSVLVFVNGVFQTSGLNYTLLGTNLTFTEGLQLDDKVQVVYQVFAGTSQTNADFVAIDDGVGGSNYQTVQEYNEYLKSGAGASDLGYTPSGTGAEVTTVQTKLRETVSVKDFGAVGDGVADDTVAIQAAVDYIDSLGGGTVYLPQGDYMTTEPISIYSNIRFIGAGGDSTKITKTTNTPVAASATTPLVCLFSQSMGDVNGDVNSILWVTAPIRAEKVEIAHMMLRSNASSPIGSPVRFGIASVGMSDSHIHDLQIEYASVAAFVSPTFWFSKIELVQTWRCIEGIAIENGTTCSVNNNYVVGARDAGYYLRDLKYSSVDSNACDDTNNPAILAYSDRSAYSSSYRLDACYSTSFKNNGAEQCFGTMWLLDSCQQIDMSNNVCISPQSDYTGLSRVALFYINTYARNVSIKQNFVFRGGVTALQGAADPAVHSDVYVNVVSTNQGFEFTNNVLCNNQYDDPSPIYGNIIPTYITPGAQGAQLFGEFTPSINLLNASGVSITYGANNKGRYSIINGWMYVEAYIHIASVTFSNTTNIFPQIDGLPLENASAYECDLLITESANVTWPSTEPFYFAIDTSQKTGLARNRDRAVALGAGGTPSFVTGSTNVVLKCSGNVYVGDLVNIV